MRGREGIPRCKGPKVKIRKRTGGYILKKRLAWKIWKLYLTKVYDEQKGMDDEGRVLGNEDKSEQWKGTQTDHHN